jgi:hypothetical protein
MDSSDCVSDIGPRNGRHANPCPGLGFRDLHADFHADIKAELNGLLMVAIYLI